MKSLSFLCVICSILIASCHSRNGDNDPQPDPTQLIIGKWRLVSIYYFDKNEKKYKTDIQTDSNYSVTEFTKSDTLLIYLLNDAADKRNCPHRHYYRFGKFQPDDYFTLTNQINFYTDCPNGDTSFTIAFRVTSDSLITENTNKFQYKFLRIP